MQGRFFTAGFEDGELNGKEYRQLLEAEKKHPPDNQ